MELSNKSVTDPTCPFDRSATMNILQRISKLPYEAKNNSAIFNLTAKDAVTWLIRRNCHLPKTTKHLVPTVVIPIIAVLAPSHIP